MAETAQATIRIFWPNDVSCLLTLGLLDGNKTRYDEGDDGYMRNTWGYKQQEALDRHKELVSTRSAAMREASYFNYPAQRIYDTKPMPHGPCVYFIDAVDNSDAWHIFPTVY